MEPKQVIVIRKDLNMRKGKIAAQAAHAAMAFITSRLDYCCNHPNALAARFSKIERDWIGGTFKKICVSVDSLEELLEIERLASEAGVVCSVIQDNGTTEFHGVPTITCLALGPDLPDRLDPISGKLPLL